jgi:hypothetical protein
MANNCFNCKFTDSAFSDLSKISENMREVRDGFYAQCLAGNNDIILDFYKRNATLPKNQVIEEVSCFRKSKMDESLDNLIDMCQQIIDKSK